MARDLLRGIEPTSLSRDAIMEADVENYSLGSSHLPTRSSHSRRSPRSPTAAPAIRSNPIVDVPAGGRPIASSGAISARRLFAHEQYFGLDAGVFRAGARSTLARISCLPPKQAWIDTRSLGEAFRLDAAASAALLSALLAGGLLRPDDNGGYCPTEILREYAHIVADRTGVQRPFSVEFQINENVMDSSIGGWDRFRD